MELWEAYEEEWSQHPTVDDLAASYLDYKPPARKGKTSTPTDTSAMNPLDFARWAKATGGSRLAPGA